MKQRKLLIQRSILFVAVPLLVLMISGAARSQEVTISAPQNGATVSGTTQVSINYAWNVEWANFYVDGSWQASTPPLSWSWNTTGFSSGTHTVSVNAYSPNSQLLGTVSITVTVANGSGGGGGGGGNWQVTPGATIPSMDGSANGIPWADSNPSDYGNYSTWGGGYGLIGGPLLSDWQAASFVQATPRSSIENGPNGWANEQANNYFNSIASSNPGYYWYQLNAVHAAYQYASWAPEAARIDGACPMANPTTAEVIQWAANKWGINPILMYADATVESGWDQTGVGDQGRSAGLFQIADRGYNHAYPGFDGAASMLARESSCFNADFWAGRLFSTFHGITGQSPNGDIGAALQSWFEGSAWSAGSYTSTVYNILGNQSWRPWYFGWAGVPY